MPARASCGSAVCSRVGAGDSSVGAARFSASTLTAALVISCRPQFYGHLLPQLSILARHADQQIGKVDPAAFVPRAHGSGQHRVADVTSSQVGACGEEIDLLGIEIVTVAQMRP